jgi:ribosomal protein S18 acetylase RimI-like enzyme
VCAPSVPKVNAAGQFSGQQLDPQSLGDSLDGTPTRKARCYTSPMPNYTIRRARLSDRDTLVNFTLNEAREAEGADLDAVRVTRGVQAAFDTSPPVRYWVADADGEVVGSTSIVTEWSDFHGGEYWWVQSIYIVPDHRGSGLLGRLLDHLAAEAQAAGAVDLRLYVHNENARAINAYRRCGFADAPYVIMRRGLG